MERKKKRERRSKLKRSVEVNDETWEWQVGRSGVVIRSPEGKMNTVGFDTFTGMSLEALFDWDGWQAITPAEVKTWVEEHMKELR